MRLRSILTSLVAVACALSLQAQTFHFAVLGDNRTPGSWRNRYEQPPAFFANIEALNRLRPAFVVDVGDLILGDADSSMVLKQWDYFDAAVSRLQVPLKLVVGNHDVRNAWTARIFERRYGPMTYSFDHAGAHFIVLNSEDVGHRDHIVGSQLEWLRADLQSHRDARHIFVFLHKPLWKNRYTSNWNEEVHPLLARYGVRAVFAGHEHHYEYCGVRDGVRYFVTGGGGAELERWGEGAGGFYHFMWVTVDGDSVHYAVVRPEGIQPVDVVTSESVRAWTSMASVRPVLFDFTEPGTARATLRLPNPGREPIVAEVEWTMPPRSDWKLHPQEIRVPVLAGDTLSLPLPVPPDTSTTFPLPRYSITYRAGDRRVLFFEGTPDLKPDGFVRQWFVIGPFDLQMEDEFAAAPAPGFLKAYPPEKEIKLEKSYKGVGGKVRWQLVQARPNGYVDLARAIQPSDRVVAYALAFVKSPRWMDTQITVGSNDGARLWVNDELVLSHHVARGAAPDQDVIAVRLRPGWNKLLLKVENLGLSWGFYLRVADVRGTLTFDAYGPLRK